jgi:hypothetical protein
MGDTFTDSDRISPGRIRGKILLILLGAALANSIVGSVDSIFTVNHNIHPKNYVGQTSTAFCLAKQGIDLNNQNYTWWGNQWVVPQSSNIPLFTQDDMLQAFSNVNTLWIGDSTTRRAYATMYALLNHSSPSITISTKELDDRLVIDVNRFANRGVIQEDSCHDRKAWATTTYFRAGMHHLWDRSGLCRRLPNGAVFDYSRVDCFDDLPRIAQLQHEFNRYSLVIIGLGIHDASMMPACSVLIPKKKVPLSPAVDVNLPNGTSNNLQEQEQQSLQTLPKPLKKRAPKIGNLPAEDVFAQRGWQGVQDIAASLHQAHNGGGNGTVDGTSSRVTKTTDIPITRTAVLWRTIGFSSAHDVNITRKILGMNHIAKASARHRLQQQQQQQQSQNTSDEIGYLGIIDWGTAIYPRSFPPYRIEGDIAAHYGLEARLLMAQMTTQQVFNFFPTLDSIHST